jgi:hypothetical protein
MLTSCWAIGPEGRSRSQCWGPAEEAIPESVWDSELVSVSESALG